MAETFPFGGDSGAADPVDGGNRKTLLVAAGGVLVLALLGYFLVLPALSGSGDEAPAAAPVTRTTKKPAAKKPAAKKPAATTTKVYTEPIARDPFKALWFKPAPVETAPAAPAAPAVMPGGTTGGTTTGGDTATAPPPGTGGDNTASKADQSFGLVKVFSRQGTLYAQVKVDDGTYTPAVGQTFAKSFKLLAVGKGTATFLYGDERFTLREGQEVIK